MEQLVNPQSDIDSLRAQQEQLVVLAQQFSDRLAVLSIEELEANRLPIEILSTRASTLRLTLINALENRLLTPSDGEGNEINSLTNWHEASHNYFLSNFELTDDPMEVEPHEPRKKEEEAAQRDVSVANGENIGENEQATVQPPPPPTQPMVEQPLVEQQVEPEQEQNQGENIAQQTAANQAVANAMSAPGEFSYQSLLIYNEMVNELLLIDAMPERALPIHFQQLRGFITRFVRLCMEREIGITHMEPILISSVVASFNDDIFRCWKSQMVSAGASLRSIREFLRNQEKIASDHWFESSKFTLSKAVKAAKEMVKQTTMHNNAPPSNFAMPSEPTQPSAPASYSEAVKTSGGNDNATPGCSHWSNNDTHRRSANRSQCNSRSSSVCDPGSQTKTGGSANNKKGDSKKNKEKKKFDCFSCRGNHPLFYCP